jgi:Lon protease-like protein
MNQYELPLFPLHTVLFPDMPLPLHIFEPRYLAMVKQCRRENTHFGVVLIQGRGVSEGVAMPYSVGTAARISRVETLANGRLNIVVTGQTRFRILEASQTKSYLTAQVETINDEGDDSAALTETAATAANLFRQYVKGLFALANRHISSMQIPSHPSGLSYAVANAMQVPMSEKQRLLECPSAMRRLQREIEMLQREIDAQTSLRRVHRNLPQGALTEILPIDRDSLLQMISRN